MAKADAEVATINYKSGCACIGEDGLVLALACDFPDRHADDSV